MTLREELSLLLNRYTGSLLNPDRTLARFLLTILVAWDDSTWDHKCWYTYEAWREPQVQYEWPEPHVGGLGGAQPEPHVPKQEEWADFSHKDHGEQ